MGKTSLVLEMSENDNLVVESVPEEEQAPAVPSGRLLALGGGIAVIAAILFGRLSEMVQHFMNTEIHSHVVLVPAVMIWLLWTERDHLKVNFTNSWVLGGCLLVPGIIAIVLSLRPSGYWSANDMMSLTAVGLLAVVLSFMAFCLGRHWMRAAIFPLSILFFAIPLPDGAVHAMERGLVLGSAEATDVLFQLSGTPVFRVDEAFHLPGFSLQVAQECSGIRSSWVLFITSILAAHMFLQTRWKQLLFVLFVIPLGIVRNGLRILTIGLLCVHEGPHMIDHWVHKRGGPVFFALSLIPLFLTLWWLLRTERKKEGKVDPKTEAEANPA